MNSFRNTVVSAPQLPDFGAMFAVWRNVCLGDEEAFYRFMSSPSPERSEFLAEFKSEVVVSGPVALVNFLA